MKTEPIFQPVSLDNLGRFSELYRACFGAQVDEGFFRWKYTQNPCGKMVGFEALAEGRTVAFYGMIPDLYRVNGQVTRVYQSMDTMTHPNFQRRGLFTRLAKLTFEHLARTDGSARLIGIAGVNSLHGMVHSLHWKQLGKGIPLVFAHRAGFLARSFWRSEPGFSVTPIHKRTGELDEYFARRVAPGWPITKHYEADFFCWRVFGKHLHKFNVLGLRAPSGKLSGLCVYVVDDHERGYVQWLDSLDRHRGGSGAAGDLGQCTHAVLRYLFQHLRGSFVYTWKPVEPNLSAALSAYGFIQNRLGRGPFSFRVPLITQVVPQTEAHATAAGVDWYDPSQFDLQPLMQDD